jgi:hypothetical protein
LFSVIGLGPFGELAFDGGNDALEESEVTIVQAARKLPDSFDGIQLRAVGRQEGQVELGSLLIAPLQMESGAIDIERCR